MSGFAFSEGPAVLGEDYDGLSFFKESCVTEHWSPTFSKISLQLSQHELELVLHMLTAAQTVAGAFGNFVTITTQHPVAWALDVEGDASDESFRSDYHELEILVAKNSTTGPRVRWSTTNKHTDDKLHTDWFDRGELESMKEGKVPAHG